MATENKEDLVKKIAVLEAQILELKKLEPVQKQLAEALKSKEEIISNEHNVRQLLEKSNQQVLEFQKQNQAKDKQIEVLKNDLNRLATLFDEYISAYQDQVKMLGVFVKNTQTVEKYLTVKIEEYNKGDKK
jgi:hypothetical protein